jgi:hypothetical protein
MGKNKNVSRKINEGEGNQTAAREYNQDQQRFVRSGRVGKAARKAERDLTDRDIRRELEQTEAIGRRHAKDEDPEVTRPHKKN